MALLLSGSDTDNVGMYVIEATAVSCVSSINPNARSMFQGKPPHRASDAPYKLIVPCITYDNLRKTSKDGSRYGAS